MIRGLVLGRRTSAPLSSGVRCASGSLATGLGGAAAAVGQGVEPEAMLETLAEAFARWLGRWRGEGLAPVRAGWLAAAHPIGTALSTPDGKGLFDGLDESGALRLRRADGSIHIVHAGDVFLI